MERQQEYWWEYTACWCNVVYIVYIMRQSIKNHRENTFYCMRMMDI